MSFALDVGQWAKSAKSDIERINKAVILELFSSVILDTPVLQGRLRGNWLISSGAPETKEINILDPSGSKTVQNVGDFVREIKGDKDFSVFLTNNLPYAYRIEYDGWSHTKAPEGMVRKNFIRISENLRSKS